MDQNPPLMTVAEVATRLSVDRTTVSALIEKQQLRAINVAPNRNSKKKCWRVSEDDLLLFLDSRRTVAPAAREPAARRKKLPPTRQWV